MTRRALALALFVLSWAMPTHAAQVTVQKVSVGSTGVFNFLLSGVTFATDTVTTATSGVAVASTRVHVGTAGTASTITEMANSATGYTTTTRCVDASSAITGNTTPITGTGTAVTIPAANMKAAANYTCTFTNTAVPIITLSKTAPATVAPGGAIAYGLSLANTGAVATGTTVVVREQLPPGVTAESITLATGANAAVNCGTLPSAAGAALNCTMTITGGIPALNGVRGLR